jgi:hypothetical protein
MRAIAKRVCAAQAHRSQRCRRVRKLLAHVEAHAASFHKIVKHHSNRQPSTTKPASEAGDSSHGSSTTAGNGSGSTSGTGSGSKPGSTSGPEPGSTSGTGSDPESGSIAGGGLPSGEGEITTPPTTSSTLQTGIDSGVEANDFSATTQLGAKLVRIEFSVGTTAAQMQPTIAGYAAIGVRVLPLAGFYGTLPTPDQARNLAGWAKAYGPGGSFWADRIDGQLAIQSIELGNETSYGYQYGDGSESASYATRAKGYALRLKEAAEAISATGIKVGLLAQADDWTGTWVNGMFSAVPNLGSYVTGWTIHPYGTSWESRLEDLVKQTAAHGAPSSIPIDITEWGLASDNSTCLSDNNGWNKCMSYNEAADTLTSTFSGIQHLLGGRFGMFVLYQVRDQETTGVTNDNQAYFGALQHELQPKGAYTTAVEATLASS